MPAFQSTRLDGNDAQAI